MRAELTIGSLRRSTLAAKKPWTKLRLTCGRRIRRSRVPRHRQRDHGGGRSGHGDRKWLPSIREGTVSPTEPATRQHASTGPALPQLPEPTHAERVRTLMSLVPVATLSTLSRKHPGFPFGSLMPFALDSAGRPIFLISNMAMHTQNLKTDPRCSLFVAQVTADGDPLGAARATLVGHAEPVADEDIASVRETYLARHENSRYWVDFADFSFFRLQPIDLYYVGGFGVMRS